MDRGSSRWAARFGFWRSPFRARDSPFGRKFFAIGPFRGGTDDLMDGSPRVRASFTLFSSFPHTDLRVKCSSREEADVALPSLWFQFGHMHSKGNLFSLRMYVLNSPKMTRVFRSVSWRALTFKGWKSSVPTEWTLYIPSDTHQVKTYRLRRLLITILIHFNHPITIPQAYIRGLTPLSIKRVKIVNFTTEWTFIRLNKSKMPFLVTYPP